MGLSQGGYVVGLSHIDLERKGFLQSVLGLSYIFSADVLVWGWVGNVLVGGIICYFSFLLSLIVSVKRVVEWLKQ